MRPSQNPSQMPGARARDPHCPPCLQTPRRFCSFSADPRGGRWPRRPREGLGAAPPLALASR
eukprot:2028062-Lingulodinium_polyedra.AAC.1